MIERFTTVSRLLLALLAFAASNGVQCQGDYTVAGDFVIGLILPIHDRNVSNSIAYDLRHACGDLNPNHAMRVSQFRRMVAAVNANQTLLPGYNIGFSIIDSCGLPNIAIAKASAWVESKKAVALVDSSAVVMPPQGASPVTLVIGAYSSRVSAPVASYFQLFDIPMLDFGATSSDLSDRVRYPLYLRTTPSDKFQAQAIINVVMQLGFNCTHLIFSKGLYGEGGADDVRQQLKLHGLCTATDQQAPTLITDASSADFEKIVQTMMQEAPQTAAVICFCEDTTIVGLLSSLQTARQISPDAPKFIIMASDYWGTSLQILGLDMAAEGAVTLTLGNTDTSVFHDTGSWFGEQLQALDKQDPWFVEYLERRFHCSFHPSDAQMACDVSEMTALSPTDVPLNDDDSFNFATSFQAAVNGIKDMIAAECGTTLTKSQCVAYINANTAKLYTYLRNTKFTNLNGTAFQFNSNGDGYPQYDFFNYRRMGSGLFMMGRYTYKAIGEWSQDAGLATYQPTFDGAQVWPGSNTTIWSECSCVQSATPKDDPSCGQ